MLDVVVVGGGHNGLSLSGFLAKAGLNVLVVERRPFPGGAVATEELIPGFRFSSCSYITHMLHEYVVEQLGIAKRLPRIHRLGRTIRTLPDGTVFREARTPEETAQTVASLFGAPTAHAYLEWTRIWDAGAQMLEPFLLNGAPSLEQIAQLAAAQGTSDACDVLSSKTYRQLLDDLFPTVRARSMFAQNIDLLDSPGVPLAHAIYRTERFRTQDYQGIPEGGMGAVSAAFAEAVGELGVELWLEAEVERIVVEHGRATGVVLKDDRHLQARAVVSNADPKRTFLKLIDAADVPGEVRARVESLDSAPGGVKLHCALKEAPDLSGLIGTDNPTDVGFIDILAGTGWYETIGPETTSGAFPDSAFLQLQIPTFVDRTLTPEGCHIVTAFMPHVAPRLRDMSWNTASLQLAKVMLRRIEQWIPNIRSALVDYQVFTPEDLEARVGLTDGNIRHLALSLNQAFDSRPLPGWSGGKTPIQSLYLCGAGIFPCGEVSGLPGYLAARTIAADFDLALPGASERSEPWVAAPVSGGPRPST